MRKKKIQIKNLKKSFNGKEILKKINLNIFESESLAIIGESGSGKSVLTKCITGLISFELGEIIFDSKYNVKTINDQEKLEHISKFGVLFQNAALFDSLTIRDNILFEKKNIDISEIISEVGLNKSILNLYPSDLSAGMQKRVGLARAILTKPEILILDEPTTGLDPIMSEQINKLIRKLVEKKKITTITITHDMDSVYHFADKVAFINNGTIFWYGEVKKIKSIKKIELKNFINGTI
ncbi:ATP-binding cassette domain-containing protein [Rickettsiales bacterium]|nr:ATP-binding cassette domain-containing protein [Rickettsiales bacterium]